MSRQLIWNVVWQGRASWTLGTTSRIGSCCSRRTCPPSKEEQRGVTEKGAFQVQLRGFKNVGVDNKIARNNATLM